MADDFSGNNHFNGTFNLNLELSLARDKTGRLLLKQAPIAEYGQMVFPAENVAVSETMTVAAGTTVSLENFSGDSYLMDLVITPGSGATKAGALVRVGDGHSVSMDYDLTTDTLTINRGPSGGNFSSTSFSHVVTEERTERSLSTSMWTGAAWRRSQAILP